MVTWWGAVHLSPPGHETECVEPAAITGWCKIEPREQEEFRQRSTFSVAVESSQIAASHWIRLLEVMTTRVK